MRTKYDNLKIMNLYNIGKTDREISEELGYNVNSFATYRRKQLKLTPNKPRETLILDNQELEILIGTLLGDSCIRYVHSDCKFPNLSFTHCLNQEEWFIWKLNKLNKLYSSHGKYKYSEGNQFSKDSHFLQYTGKNMKCLVEIRDIFYENNIKIIPTKYLEKHFSELSMYCLMMDDGHYDKCSNSFGISTNCFKIEELENFCKFLINKFDLHFSIKKDKSLYLKHISNDKMIKLLNKYNTCGSMNYKCGPLKTPLNGETPEVDNPVLNLYESEENA